jgi:hypothetical protein
MTPKEKAQELVQKYYNRFEHTISDEYAEVEFEVCKECALIAVDEMINILKVFPEKDTTSKSVVNFSISRIMYLVQVKQEIEKL